MVNKRFLPGIFVIMLVFGLMASGCDNGSGTHIHSFGTSWKTDTNNHWHECACGEKSNIETHTPIDLITTVATETADGLKIQECTVCKLLKTQVIPATGAGHTHSHGTSWRANANNHWHECSCGDQADHAGHNYSGDICIICGYRKTSGGEVNVAKTLVFFGITSDLMGKHGNDPNGFIVIYPAGTSWDTVRGEILSFRSDSTPMTNAVAANTFNRMDEPVKDGILYTATAPLYTAASLISGGQALWTDSGTFDIYTAGSDEDYIYIYQGANITITSATTNIPAGSASLVYQEVVPPIPAIRGTISFTNVPTDPDVTGIYIIVDASYKQFGVYPDDDIWYTGRNIGNGIDFRADPPNDLSWKIPLQELVWRIGEKEDYFLDSPWLRFTIYIEYNNNHLDERSYSVWPPEETRRQISSLEDAQEIDLGTLNLTRPSP